MASPFILRQLNESKNFLSFQEKCINVDSIIPRILKPGLPPTDYTVSFKIKGVIGKDGNGLPIFGFYHKVKIKIPPDYPMNRPILIGMSPMLHSNWINDSICTGHFQTTQSLEDLVIKLMKMTSWDVNYIRCFPYPGLDMDVSKWCRSMIDQHIITQPLEEIKFKNNNYVRLIN